jgi:CDP-4-dehydro-6-deoxyglucose reductase/ferredoxin-NAD(P)+ reductase (naphthalene dioxygenase ferredoxin-specific)
MIAADLADLDGAKAYLAGPPPMVEAATALLAETRGMRRQDIHADAFYSEAEKAALTAPLPEAATVAR